jgi:hypothetical protein
VALLRREIRESQPNVTLIDGPQARPDAATEERAALGALRAQGPAMARLLEIVADAAMFNGVAIQSVRVEPDGEHWNITVEARADGADLARTRAAADNFLRELQAPAAFGEPLQPPTRRVVSGDAGINLSATYRVNR